MSDNAARPNGQKERGMLSKFADSANSGLKRLLNDHPPQTTACQQAPVTTPSASSTASQNSRRPSAMVASLPFTLPAELSDHPEELKRLLRKAASKISELQQADNNAVMEQLAQVSKQAADAKMSKEELEAQNKRLTADIASLKEDISKKEEQISKLKDRVQFTQVDKAQQDLAKIKQENQQLVEKLNEAQKKHAELQQIIDEDKQMIDVITKERNRLWEAQTDAAKNAKKMVVAEAEVQRLSQELEALKKTHESTLIAHAEQLSTLQKQTEQKLDEMEAQRRNYKQTTESVQKDLKKLVISDHRNQAENQRLREELARKTKCLKDAMEALRMYMDKEATEKKSSNPFQSLTAIGNNLGNLAAGTLGLGKSKPRKSETSHTPGGRSPAPARSTVTAASPLRPQSTSPHSASTTSRDELP